MTTKNHAKDQAAAQLEYIKTLVAALECDYDRLEELRYERDGMQYDADNVVGGDAALSSKLALWLSGEEGQELAILEAQSAGCENRNIEVRTGWYSPGDESAPEEFQILLCTGGPAVRIMGELNEHGEPTRAWLEYQDWDTPWTEYFEAGAVDMLLAYANFFYFGE